MRENVPSFFAFLILSLIEGEGEQESKRKGKLKS